MEHMEQAAEQAAKELLEHIESWTAKDVARWWANWYMQAGHKRLGRLMANLGKLQGKLQEV